MKRHILLEDFKIIRTINYVTTTSVTLILRLSLSKTNYSTSANKYLRVTELAICTLI